MKQPSEKGMVLSILRSALEDGPGIRTTLFLKGCPLNCLWCHNPESKVAGKELAFFADRCTLCGACVEACPNNVHSIVDGVHLVNRSLCNITAACVEACNYSALEITGKEMSAEEVMEVVVKDKAFFDASGGGLTISGGEPMMQFGFVKQVLELARTEGIHTCIDTSGHAPQEYFREVLPLTDLFLFDIKASDPFLHETLTGVNPDLIMKNFRFLYENGAAMEVRLPLIQGVNDQPEHLQQIKELKAGYPNLMGITVMPFHNTGHCKYDRYGYNNPMAGKENTGEELIRRWNGILGNRNDLNARSGDAD